MPITLVGWAGSMFVWDSIVKPGSLSALNFLVFFLLRACSSLLKKLLEYGIKRAILGKSAQERFENGSRS